MVGTQLAQSARLGASEVPLKSLSASAQVPSESELSECASDDAEVEAEIEAAAETTAEPAAEAEAERKVQWGGEPALLEDGSSSVVEPQQSGPLKPTVELFGSEEGIVAVGSPLSEDTTNFTTAMKSDSATSAMEAPEAPQGKKKGAVVTFNASHSDYEAVAAAAEARGWRIVKDEKRAKACNIHWIDDGSIAEWFRQVEPWMRVNHFPGMNNALARKTRLARNMNRLQRLFPKEYQFLPATWVLPDDIGDLEKKFNQGGESKIIYIVKPDHLCQGKGIFLTVEWARLKSFSAECRQKDTSAVVQRYIMHPMLIDGLKFDLRLYFLVAGKPTANGGLDLRCFLFRDGLVRLCTTQYSPPTAETMDQKCMHLTNYAVNKNSNDFQPNTAADDDGAGSKRSLRWFMRVVEDLHGPRERRKLWFKLMGLCVKTVLTVQPFLQAECTATFPRDQTGGQMGWRCFEILGIDVMLDEKRKPYLIEINHLPSFTTDSPLDADIKRRLLDQTLELTCSSVSAKDAKTYEQLVRQRREGGSASAATTVPAHVIPGDGKAGDATSVAAGSTQSLLDSPTYKDFDRAYPPPPEAAKLSAQCQSIQSRVQELFDPVYAVRRKEEAREAAAAAQKPPLLPKASAASPSAGSAGVALRRSRSPSSPHPQQAQQAQQTQQVQRAQHQAQQQAQQQPLPARRREASPGAAASAVGATGLPNASEGGKKRSLSAPMPPRSSLPTIPRSDMATPRGLGSYRAAMRGSSQPPQGAGLDGSSAGDRHTPAAKRALSRNRSSEPRVFLALKPAQIML